MESHNIITRLYPQPKLVVDLATPEGWKHEKIDVVGWLHAEMA